MCVLVTFDQWGHFVMLIISVQSWTYVTSAKCFTSVSGLQPIQKISRNLKRFPREESLINSYFAEKQWLIADWSNLRKMERGKEKWEWNGGMGCSFPLFVLCEGNLNIWHLDISQSSLSRLTEIRILHLLDSVLYGCCLTVCLTSRCLFHDEMSDQPIRVILLELVYLI